MPGKDLIPLTFRYALLRRDSNGKVKTIKVHDEFDEAIGMRNYLRKLAKRRDSRAYFYVKMTVEENRNAAT